MGRRWRVLALGLGCALFGFFVAVLVGWRWFVDRPGPVRGRAVAVSWPDDLDAREAARLLADLELTDNRAAMELFLRATRAPSCFRPGPHLLADGATPRQLRAMLCRSDARATVTVTIPEGFHRFAIAERLEALGVSSSAAFLHASADPELLAELDLGRARDPVGDTAEGFLFPATYSFKQDSDPRGIVRVLVQEAKRRFQRMVAKHGESFKSLEAELGLDRRAVFTLASMVEKEAAVAEERTLIASVFLNRLRDRELRRMQSDPTGVYGCFAIPERIPACAGFAGKATPALLRDPANVFSTYVVDGLPPGPIANPGEESIAAVLAPADTPYLYFVAKGEGRHEFSASYEDHLAAVARLKRLRER